MNKIIVIVEGGVVQNIYSKDHIDTEVIVIDWDNIRAGDDPPPYDEYMNVSYKQIY